MLLDGRAALLKRPDPPCKCHYLNSIRPCKSQCSGCIVSRRSTCDYVINEQNARAYNGFAGLTGKRISHILEPIRDRFGPLLLGPSRAVQRMTIHGQTNFQSDAFGEDVRLIVPHHNASHPVLRYGNDTGENFGIKRVKLLEPLSDPFTNFDSERLMRGLFDLFCGQRGGSVVGRVAMRSPKRPLSPLAVITRCFVRR